MSVSISQLLGKRQKIVDAEHTLKITLDAAKEGNLRLAVSRGITAIIQAAAAAVGAAPPIVRRAEAIIQTVRNIIQGAVIKKAALGSLRYYLGNDTDVPLPILPLPEDIKAQRLVEAFLQSKVAKTEEQKAREKAEREFRWPIPIAEMPGSKGSIRSGAPAVAEGITILSTDPFHLESFLIKAGGIDPERITVDRASAWVPGMVQISGREASRLTKKFLKKSFMTFPKYLMDNFFDFYGESGSISGSLMGSLLRTA